MGLDSFGNYTEDPATDPYGLPGTLPTPPSSQVPINVPTPNVGGPVQAPSSGGFNWGSLAAPVAGAVGSAANTMLGQQPTYAQIAENQRQFNIQQQNRAQEVARRTQVQGMSMPAQLNLLGYDPSKTQAIADNYVKQNTPANSTQAGTLGADGSVGYGSSQVPTVSSLMSSDKLPQGMNSNQSTPSTPGIGSAVAKTALGAAPAVGLAVAHSAAAGGAMAGLGGTIAGLASNPITIAAAGALGAGLLIKHFVGQGRKAADILTHPGGMQYAFEQTLKDIDGQNLPADQAWKLKTQAYNELVQLGLAHAQQGDSNAKKVVNQMFNTISPLFGQKNPLGGQ